MKIIIIRHGDPDYEHDSLTPKGWREVEYLSEWISRMDVTKVYVSPLGRAKDTAAATLKKLHQTATECEWLREFDAPIHRPDVTDRKMITWDWLPQDWTKEHLFYDHERWADHPIMAESNVKAQYEWVIGNFDALLASHGYVREQHYYRAERANKDTLVFFLSFWIGVCAFKPPFGHLTYGTLASCVRCAQLCDDACYGRTPGRDRTVSHDRIRRYLSFECKW